MVPLDVELEMNVLVTAYRIAQEAIVNAARHARASRIDVTVEEREAGVYVRVSDDGSGFLWTGEPVEGHLGLSSMRERAQLAGGWLRVETAPGSGTSVEFWLPSKTPPAGSVD